MVVVCNPILSHYPVLLSTDRSEFSCSFSYAHLVPEDPPTVCHVIEWLIDLIVFSLSPQSHHSSVGQVQSLWCSALAPLPGWVVTSAWLRLIGRWLLSFSESPCMSFQHTVSAKFSIWVLYLQNGVFPLFLWDFGNEASVVERKDSLVPHGKRIAWNSLPIGSNFSIPFQNHCTIHLMLSCLLHMLALSTKLLE